MENPELILTPTQVAVLHQMVAGFTRQTIAETLFLSPRTVDKQVAEIKRELGTWLRLCLGIRAVRYRMVSPNHPIEHARRARLGGTWHPPTSRQLQILHLLADDTPIDEVCSEIKTSGRTIRRDLSRAAAANGARNLTHAGALFEALGWTHPPWRTTRWPRLARSHRPSCYAGSSLGRFTIDICKRGGDA